MAVGDTPLVDTIAAMNAVALTRCELDPAVLVAVRLAALAAVHAPPASYLLHIEPAVESGVTLDNVADVLVAVAPIIGAPAAVVAARNIATALGVALDAVVAEAAAEEAAAEE